MTRASIWAVICVVASAAAAEAADTRIRAFLGQTGEVSDNRQLSKNSKGESYSSVSTLLVDAIARTATTTIQVVGDLAYRAYGGPGDRQTPDALDKGVVGRITHEDRLGKYYVAGSLRQRDVSQVQLEENGFITRTGFVNTASAIAGFDRRMSAVDTVTWFASATHTDFSNASGTPFSDFASKGVWYHQVNHTLELLSSLEYQLLLYDNLANTQTQFVRALLGMESRLSPRLIFAGNIGAGWVNTHHDTLMFAPGLSGSSVNFLSNLRWTYQFLDSTLVSLAVWQSVGPTGLGELVKRAAVSLSLRHTLSPISYLLLATQFSHSTQTSGDTNYLFASATYGTRLTPEWRSEISYTYRHREPITASSNTVTVRLLRDVIVSP
jgi:hypothetical protein